MTHAHTALNSTAMFSNLPLYKTHWFDTCLICLVAYYDSAGFLVCTHKTWCHSQDLKVLHHVACNELISWLKITLCCCFYSWKNSLLHHRYCQLGAHSQLFSFEHVLIHAVGLLNMAKNKKNYRSFCDYRQLLMCVFWGWLRSPSIKSRCISSRIRHLVQPVPVSECKKRESSQTDI